MTFPGVPIPGTRCEGGSNFLGFNFFWIQFSWIHFLGFNFFVSAKLPEIILSGLTLKRGQVEGQANKAS